MDNGECPWCRRYECNRTDCRPPEPPRTYCLDCWRMRERCLCQGKDLSSGATADKPQLPAPKTGSGRFLLRTTLTGWHQHAQVKWTLKALRLLASVCWMFTAAHDFSEGRHFFAVCQAIIGLGWAIEAVTK